MCSEFPSQVNMTTQPHWFPVLATPNILTIAEECVCVCNQEGPCCCHGEKDAGTSESSDTPEVPLKVLPDFEEFDGVDDILAVSHLSEKPSIKKRNPLLRAKTLPAIISPSLSIVQAPLDPQTRSKIPTITHTEINGHSKISPGKSRSKRSPGSSGKKNSTSSEMPPKKTVALDSVAKKKNKAMGGKIKKEIVDKQKRGVRVEIKKLYVATGVTGYFQARSKIPRIC
ncbi:uncharacterized protein LOC118188137 [Stegodyphus dumicola]|uniref:uncharacterized protein LOC118188137 n=1 Tax=Stegodyphus dumicola TaxID=202533 RepID=UPI0015B19D5B|nr:uncharacterized protein LOC118188137 [Stegodyphus dumicola]